MSPLQVRAVDGALTPRSATAEEGGLIAERRAAAAAGAAAARSAAALVASDNPPSPTRSTSTVLEVSTKGKQSGEGVGQGAPGGAGAASRSTLGSIWSAHAAARSLSGLTPYAPEEVSPLRRFALATTATSPVRPSSAAEYERRISALSAELAERDASEEVLDERLRQLAEATRARARAFEEKEAQLAAWESRLRAWEERLTLQQRSLEGTRRAIATQGQHVEKVRVHAQAHSGVASAGGAAVGLDGTLLDLIADAEAADAEQEVQYCKNSS